MGPAVVTESAGRIATPPKLTLQALEENLKMRARLATIAVGAMSVVGVLALASPSAAVASPDVTCSQNPSTNSQLSGSFSGTNVNIHTGPFTSCTSVGEGQPSHHNVTLHCRKLNSNNVEWVYLTDHTTNKTGWSAAAFVAWFGTLANC